MIGEIGSNSNVVVGGTGGGGSNGSVLETVVLGSSPSAAANSIHINNPMNDLLPPSSGSGNGPDLGTESCSSDSLEILEEDLSNVLSVSAPVTNGGSSINDIGDAPAADESDPDLISTAKAAQDTNTYDDLFPSLVPSGPPGAPGANPIGEWNKKPKLPSSFVTQVFRVPTEERKEMIGGSAAGGPSGAGNTPFGGDESLKILKSVSISSGAKVEMSSSKDNSLAFLLTGKPDAVLKARRELLASFQTQSVSSIAVPKEHHKAILGRGGSRKTEIEERSGVKIRVPNMDEESLDVSVSGPRKSVQAALEEIRNISEEQSRHASETLTIPKIYHPFIHGPNGETAKSLGATYPNVRINIPHPSAPKDDIFVTGDREGVAAVVEAINGIYKDIEKRATTVSVEVRKPQHKYIFGPKGQTLNDILAETGVFVEIPPSDCFSDTITLRGPPEKLGTALNKVYEKANSIVTLHIPCPSWLHKYIIGKKGASIQKLKVILPKVHVEFGDLSDAIKIEGPPEEVEQARQNLEAQVHSLTSTMSFAEVTVDPKYHKYIIGKNGATVNKLKGESDVSINIPEAPGSLIRIEGLTEGVKRSESELRVLVKRMANEKELELSIESRFHRSLIGPKGERIQKIRCDYPEVQITFPEVGKASEAVRLRGPSGDVDKVTKLLEEAHAELKETSYQIKVPLYKDFHKYIIGKGGATIKKIRSETETRVDIPNAGESSDVITITGRKAHVERAVQKLLTLQSEVQNIVNVTVDIPSKIHNAVIGSGGKLIQSISEDCGGVSIVFPPPDSASDTVNIRGPKEDVEKARKMLGELSSQRLLCSFSESVRASPSHHKFLIGRAGASIQAMRERTGAKFIFPNEMDEDKELITILGSKEAVAAAKIELEARIKDLEFIVEDTLNVDPKYHRHFVSRRGEVIRQIGEEFGGVSVSFPRNGVPGDIVTLKGSRDCVEGAKARIQEIVSDLESEVSIELNIPQVHHRNLMGPRGIKVQKVCGDYGVTIKFPEKEASQDTILISGKADKCQGASEALQALVPLVLEVSVPFEFHRFIIGSKGAGVRSLMTEHGVNINVPAPDLQEDTISITGPPENAAEAKAALLDRVAGFQAEKEDRILKSFEVSLEINPEYHPKIIGRKGAVIQALRTEYDVVIVLPKREDKEASKISITGYEASVQKAKEAILGIVADIEAMVKEDVTIDHRVHSKIIGRKGMGIRKIMGDYSVDIKLPREGDSNRDLVVIMGKEDNVLDCKDHLFNLEEEFLQDLQENDWMEDYIKPVAVDSVPNAPKPNRGFEVAKGAPWHGASDEAFPTLGGAPGGGGAANGPAAAAPISSAAATPLIPAWGPKRF
eukprot:TRINITY_DN700_c0_g1_i6.p1 TRINITY_DN700_c0_g1~~TRINITY_DN700_c0_g1_i6.p1  ORF type:complete len:1348 (+),score=556.54 TRINITY_DN700_c0_g1_i6:85-4128(+)